MSEALPPILQNNVPEHLPYRYMVTVNDIIEAAHQLKLPYESKCNFPHGHSYRVRAVIGATQLDGNGMVVDFIHVKGVIRQYDHQNLNDYFAPTTAEKFGEVLLDQLQQAVFQKNPNAQVIEVAVGETATTMVSVTYLRS
jgi:6-pyruvoyltetrahydropterin/6-carboxytetrahydropterin synthase